LCCSAVFAAPTGDAWQRGTYLRSICFAAAWVTPGQKQKDKHMLGRSITFPAAALARGVLAAPAFGNSAPEREGRFPV